MSETSVEPLLAEAQSAPVKPGRSKLELHRVTICELRRKGWKFAEIAGWLKMRGVGATTSNVHRYFEQNKHRPQAVEPEPAPPAPPSVPADAEKPKRKIRFNLRESE